jgi:predicted DNA-binding transcriptional regulator AlpA
MNTPPQDSGLFDPKEAETLLHADKINIVKRVKDGKPLTEAQRARLLGHSDGTRFAKNQTELAIAIGVDRKTIQRWKKDESFPKPKTDGRWDIAEVRAWRGEDTEEELEAQDEDLPTKAQGEARRVWLQVAKLELELDTWRGKWVELEVAKSEISAMVIKCKTLLLSIGDRIGPLLSGLEPAEASERINDEIRHALSQISEEGLSTPTPLGSEENDPEG